MDNLDVRIVLTDRKSSYHRGDLLAGKVLIDAKKSTKLSGLDLEIFWRSTGEGSSDGYNIPAGNLFRGELLAGHHEFDFAIEATQQLTAGFAL